MEDMGQSTASLDNPQFFHAQDSVASYSRARVNKGARYILRSCLGPRRHTLN